MNQTLPVHPPLTHSTKLAPNKSGDVFPKLQKDEFPQGVDTDKRETQPDKDRQGTDSLDIENDFSAALLILSPIETARNTATSKNIANIQSGSILSGQVLASNGNTPQAETKNVPSNFQHAIAGNQETGQTIQRLDVQSQTIQDLAEIHKDKITRTNSTGLATQESTKTESTKNLQGIGLPNTTAANTAGQAGNAQINQIQILAETNPEVATNKAVELSPTIRSHRNAHGTQGIQDKIRKLSGIQISTAANTGPNSGTISVKTPMMNMAQSQAIITQLSDAVTLQAGKAISGPVSNSIPGTTSPTQTKSGHPPAPILVQLSPAELGRVHIQFSFDAADKITAYIIAESTETGALLKRNSELLTAHLKLGGFDNIDLNFETKPEKNFSDFTQNNSKSGSNMFGGTDDQHHNSPDNKSGQNTAKYISQGQFHGTASANQQVVTHSVRPLTSTNMDQLDISI